MSDVGISALLSDATAAATAPAAGREQAFAKLSELRSDQGFQERLLRNDTAAVSELQSLRLQALKPTKIVVGAGPQAEHVEYMLDKLQERAGLSAEELEQIRVGTPISAQEFKFAQQELLRCKRDQEFVKKLFAGDPAAQAKWSRLHVLTTSKISTEKDS